MQKERVFRLEEGDVIRCAALVCAYRDKGLLRVYRPEEPEVHMTYVNDRFPDKTRRAAQFVVEHVVHPLGEYCPDSVRVRRLDNDGTYNPEGELIEITMKGGCAHRVLPSEVEVAGKMLRNFVPC